MTNKKKTNDESDPRQEILDKIIERKSKQTSALKRLLDELNKDSLSSSEKNDK